jgi:hypothetical protein
MTPTAEARFIALWQQGLSQDNMAQRLGIPRGTVASRAHTPMRQGKIQPRPRRGAYPSQRAKARTLPDGPPARAPAPAEPPARTPGTIKQWTVRLSQPLIEAIKAQAAPEGKEPSHLVEELLWKALTDRR